MFRSVAHQVYGNPELHGLVREKCMDYIETEKIYFMNYVEGEFDDYLEAMRQNGSWGDHVEIQAMSELYDRAIEVYAYSLTPLNTYQGAPTLNEPMRLSYHFQSHYNSIINPDTHERTCMTTHPGEVEDVQIEEAKRRGGRRGAVEVKSEDTQLQLALAASRNQFAMQGEIMSDYDRAINASLRSQSANPEVNQALVNSLGTQVTGRMMSEEEQIRQAMAISLGPQQPSVDSEIQQALAASLITQQIEDPDGKRIDSDLQRALEVSQQESKVNLNDDLQKAMEISQQDSKSNTNGMDNIAFEEMRTKAIEFCRDSLGLGSHAMCEKAFQLMYDSNVSFEMLTQNMTNYLLSQEGRT